MQQNGQVKHNDEGPISLLFSNLHDKKNTSTDAPPVTVKSKTNHNFAVRMPFNGRAIKLSPESVGRILRMGSTEGLVYSCRRTGFIHFVGDMN